MDQEHSDRLLRATATAESNSHQALLHAVYDAVVRSDYAVFAALVTDNVTLSIRGFGPLDGTWQGRDAVVSATRKNFAEIDSQQPNVECIVSQGNSVAVLLHETGVFRSTGQSYSVRGVQWFTFIDGKVSRIDEILGSI